MIPNNHATFMVQCLDLNLRPYNRGDNALQFCYPTLSSVGHFETVMLTIYRVSHKCPLPPTKSFKRVIKRALTHVVGLILSAF